MRCTGASGAALAAAMTFSLALLGQTARASDAKPVIRSMIDRNTILAPSASSSTAITYGIARYMEPPKRLEGLALINPATCKEIAVGAWTPTDSQACGQEKCGKVTTGTETETIVSGLCAGATFTFATIYYEWTAHNNQSTLSAPPNSVADTFNATWTSGTTPNYTAQYTFDINVPVVRPDHETTAFLGFDPDGYGLWKQTLIPPSSDPSFDFSGETLREFAAGQAGPDMCWFQGSGRIPFDSITGGTWKVLSRNIYSADKVGYGPDYVNYYRGHSPTLLLFGTCGTRFGQEMEIHAPSDPPNKYTPYGSTNTGDLNDLGASMDQFQVTSIRAGNSAIIDIPTQNSGAAHLASHFASNFKG